MRQYSAEVLAFRSSATLVDALKAELQLPGISAALKALDTMARPTGLPAIEPGVPYDTTIAHEFCALNGINFTLKALRSMAYRKDELSPLDEEAEPSEFEDQIPPEFRKRPKTP